MEKVFILNGLHCPHCSAEIEKDIGELDGVVMSSINLVNQTLIVGTAVDYSGNLFETVKKIVYSHEPDVVVTEKGIDAAASSKKEEHGLGETGRDIFKLAAGTVVYILGLILPIIFKGAEYVSLGFLIAAYVILGSNVVLQAFRNILKGRVFDENFLMTRLLLCCFIK